MREIKDYQILESGIETNLVAEVKTYIAEGWQPFGSLCVTAENLNGNERFIYTQAMVKYY